MISGQCSTGENTVVWTKLCLVPRTNAVFYREFNSWGFRGGPFSVPSLFQRDLLNFKRACFDIVGLLKTNFPVLDILSKHCVERIFLNVGCNPRECWATCARGSERDHNQFRADLVVRKGWLDTGLRIPSRTVLKENVLLCLTASCVLATTVGDWEENNIKTNYESGCDLWIF